VIDSKIISGLWIKMLKNTKIPSINELNYVSSPQWKYKTILITTGCFGIWSLMWTLKTKARDRIILCVETKIKYVLM
jgi:hypothetical protein